MKIAVVHNASDLDSIHISLLLKEEIAGHLTSDNDLKEKVSNNIFISDFSIFSAIKKLNQ